MRTFCEKMINSFRLTADVSRQEGNGGEEKEGLGGRVKRGRKEKEGIEKGVAKDEAGNSASVVGGDRHPWELLWLHGSTWLPWQQVSLGRV